MGLLSILIFIPLLGGLVSLGTRSAYLAKIVALTTALVTFVVSLGIYSQFNANTAGFDMREQIAWVATPGLSLSYFVGIDGMSMMLVLLTTFLMVITLIGTWNSVTKNVPQFMALLMLLETGMLGVFLSLDLFFLYIFHEFALLPTFLLIGIWGTQNRQFASLQLTLYLTLGSLILLAGIIALVVAMPEAARTFDLTNLAVIAPVLHDGAYVWPAFPMAGGPLIFSLLLIGCGMLVSLVPFHTWAPPGYASAPPAASMLHAGVLKKFGLYVLLRVAWPLFPDVANHCQELLVGLVLAHIFYVGFITLAQKELPTMLGYSSVMHMGYLFLGLISWDKIGLAGLVLLMVAHGLSTATLFALSGEIEARTGTVRFEELGGLAKKAPFLATLFVIASMAALGLPGLPNFAGELLIFFGAWRAHPFVVALVLWGSVMTATYFLRAVRSVCFGPLPEKFAQLTDLKTASERAPYLLLAAAMLFLGLAPGVLLRWITASLPPTPY